MERSQLQVDEIIYYIHTYIWAINLSTMYKLGYTSKHVAAEVLCKVAGLHKGL